MSESTESSITTPNQSSRQSCDLRSCLRVSTRSVVPVIVWIVYLCLGSLMFLAIEGEKAELRRETVKRIKRELPERFADLAEYLSNNCNDSEQINMIYAINRTFVKLLDHADFGPATRLWTFYASLRFCLTVISTIGYGYLAPKTQLGRGICIIYTCIGLPLNLIFMACVGRNLATLIGVFYSKMKKFCFWVLSFHKLGMKQHTGKLDTGEMKTWHASLRKPTEMTSGIPDVRVTNTELHDMTLIKQVSRNGSTNYSSQYQQWPERESESRSLSQKSLSDLPQTPSRSTLAEPQEVPRKMKHLHHHDETAPDVPIVFLIFIIAGYCCVGAWSMARRNHFWTFLDGVYFWFITITTVGFGDLEFQNAKVEDQDDSGYEAVLIQISVVAFVVIGLALMSAFVTLVIERGHQYRRTLQMFMCNSVSDTGEAS